MVGWDKWTSNNFLWIAGSVNPPGGTVLRIRIDQLGKYQGLPITFLNISHAVPTNTKEEFMKLLSRSLSNSRFCFHEFQNSCLPFSTDTKHRDLEWQSETPTIRQPPMVIVQQSTICYHTNTISEICESHLIEIWNEFLINFWIASEWHCRAISIWRHMEI